MTVGLGGFEVDEEGRDHSLLGDEHDDEDLDVGKSVDLFH